MAPFLLEKKYAARPRPRTRPLFSEISNWVVDTVIHCDLVCSNWINSLDPSAIGSVHVQWYRVYRIKNYVLHVYTHVICTCYMLHVYTCNMYIVHVHCTCTCTLYMYIVHVHVYSMHMDSCTVCMCAGVWIAISGAKLCDKPFWRAWSRLAEGMFDTIILFIFIYFYII